MYPNLEAEISRRNYSKFEFSKSIGIPYSTLIAQLSSGRFTTDEAFKIMDVLKIDTSKIRYLFATDAA